MDSRQLDPGIVDDVIGTDGADGAEKGGCTSLGVDVPVLIDTNDGQAISQYAESRDARNSCQTSKG